MAHAVFLGLQVFFGVLVGLDFGGYALNYGDSGAFQGGHLIGIVGDKAHGLYAEMLQHSGGQSVLAIVGIVAELFVGLDGVKAPILEFVSLELGHEADTAAFLLLIDKDAGAGVGDHGESHFELLAAVTAHGSENVSGEALGVNTDERRSRVNVAHHEGDSFFFAGIRTVGGEVAFEAENAELSPAGGKVGLGNFADHSGRHTLIICGYAGLRSLRDGQRVTAYAKGMGDRMAAQFEVLTSAG